MEVGPFHVRQAVGQYGVPITMYKIRTMKPHADADLGMLVQTHGIDELGKPRNDPRVTPLGKVLRRYGIDELPQIANILNGEMALIGIRPRTEEEWSTLSPNLRDRAIKYKPGLLSPAYAFCPKDKQELIAAEHTYLDSKEHSPFLADLKIFYTILYNVLFRGVRSK